jgi:hypothetical protein
MLGRGIEVSTGGRHSTQHHPQRMRCLIRQLTPGAYMRWILPAFAVLLLLGAVALAFDGRLGSPWRSASSPAVASNWIGFADDSTRREGSLCRASIKQQVPTLRSWNTKIAICS